jgi:hypothetical protein
VVEPDRINQGNLWRRLALPKGAEKWSLTSLQQRLVKTGGRLVKHARYYWLLLAESHLTRRLFGSMLRRMEALPLPAGEARRGGETNLADGEELSGEVSGQVLGNGANHGSLVPEAPQPGTLRALALGRMQERRRTDATGVYWYGAGKAKWKFRSTTRRTHGDSISGHTAL